MQKSSPDRVAHEAQSKGRRRYGVYSRLLPLAAALVLVQTVALISFLYRVFAPGQVRGLAEIIIISSCSILIGAILLIRLIKIGETALADNETPSHEPGFTPGIPEDISGSALDQLAARGAKDSAFTRVAGRDAALADGAAGGPAGVTAGHEETNLDFVQLSSCMQEGLCVMRAGRVLFTNNNLAYLLGSTPAGMLGSPISEFVHPDDVGLMQILGGEEEAASPSRATLRLHTSLGDQRWVICSAHPTRWAGDPATLLLFENIGPLKQAQRSLEEHEQQSRILIERTPLGIAMFDSMGQLKVANTAWYSLWSNIAGVGARRFNILQDPFLPRADVDRAIRQVFNGQESGVSALEHSAPWGETRWLNMNFHPMQNAVGQLIGIVMIQQDITDHVRSSRRETELNDQLATLRLEYVQKQERLAMMIDAMPSTIIYIDEKDNIALMNRTAEMRADLPRQRLVGQNLGQLRAQFGQYFDLLAKARGEHKVVQAGRVPVAGVQGLRYEDVLIYPVDYKKQPGAILRIDEVSARVQAEKAAEQKHMVEVLENFLRHNPGAVRDACSVTAELDALLEAAAGLDANLVPVDLHYAINSLLESINADAPAKTRLLIQNITIKREYDPKLQDILSEPEILADALHGILRSLVAWRYENSPPDQPMVITLRTASAPASGSSHGSGSGVEGRYVRLSIICNGPKLGQDQALRIFEPYSFTASELDGLDLARSYFKITFQLGGKAQCLPIPTGGLLFLCDLPAAPASGQV